MSFLTIADIKTRYGPVEALRGVDLDVNEGSIVVLLGPNGAGKSTLFGCLLGTVLPDSGEIQIREQPITADARRQFGYLAERVTLYPQRTVRENAEYIARLKGIDPGVIDDSLRRVGLEDLRERKTSQLSKGQLQRAGLAIALAGRPQLLVLDEPFNGLDPLVLEMFLETVREERERGATILISTHTISAAEEIATHAAILLDGKLAASGSIEELREQFPGHSLESIYHRVAKNRVKKSMEAMAA